ncbi:multiple sugar transport system substrate-binding protein [Spinactinospora alkalitolerans]|uniref:Multiple sugar transport system substrate-binding protein n=1 Tax=Spinactinospora alkalitolerans TaxID=687207 RepID=A0A852TYS3_9ACTN|nr:sugar ABC transporter substrate-binding protein [Spinactinospora alkalitolerans]NYE47943.1 multiple sugar transport system substrate-binding protein [Spinactinospora alkalitolerans]
MKCRPTSILLVAGTTFAATALTACGTPSENSGQVTLEITWWGNPDRNEATQEAVKTFEEQNPNITVEVIPASFSGYYDKLNTQFASNAAPDIFQNDQVTTYADKGLLLNLGEYPDTLDTSAIDDGFLEQAKIDGELYEAPAGASPMAMVLRPGMLEDAGVEIPTAETTWEELADSAEDVQQALDKGTWALADSSSQHNHFQVFLRQRGLDWFDEDGGLGFARDDLVDWWRYWADLRDAGATPPADVTVAAAGGDVTESPVGKGTVAMSVYGTSITLPSDDWAYGPLPNEADNPGAYLMRSVAWAVNAETEHPDEAVELVDFLVNDLDAGAIQGMVRGVPPNQDIAADVYKELDDKERQIADYVDYLGEQGNSRPAPAPDPAGTRNIRSEMFDRHAQEVLFARSSPEQAAEAFMTEAEQLLDSNGRP